MSGLSGIGGSTAASSAGSDDTSSRIAALMKQISKFVTSLRDISQDTSLDKEAKQQKVALVQARIQMLEAQITQLQKQEADKSVQSDITHNQKSDEDSAESASGVDVYV